jgi:hypothetical protein
MIAATESRPELQDLRALLDRIDDQAEDQRRADEARRSAWELLPESERDAIEAEVRRRLGELARWGPIFRAHCLAMVHS